MDILQVFSKKNKNLGTTDSSTQLRAIGLALKPQIEEAVTNGAVNASDVATVVATEWKQPLGSTDAYDLGYIVSHNNKLWRSNVSANVWEPGATGIRQWDEV